MNRDTAPSHRRIIPDVRLAPEPIATFLMVSMIKFARERSRRRVPQWHLRWTIPFAPVVPLT